ncbi:unnamed protein product [Onchocerca flexuosa]|uniref:Uncharacterized protein n=1 Tax=Onchocerca flexuosa TaxID=387005 RepID=A0A183H5Q2_9BILA|nr:unnamed protein product [Onchocerca flexuosa]
MTHYNEDTSTHTGATHIFFPNRGTPLGGTSGNVPTPNHDTTHCMPDSQSEGERKRQVGDDRQKRSERCNAFR